MACPSASSRDELWVPWLSRCELLTSKPSWEHAALECVGFLERLLGLVRGVGVCCPDMNPKQYCIVGEQVQYCFDKCFDFMSGHHTPTLRTRVRRHSRINTHWRATCFHEGVKVTKSLGGCQDTQSSSRELEKTYGPLAQLVECPFRIVASLREVPGSKPGWSSPLFALSSKTCVLKHSEKLFEHRAHVFVQWSQKSPIKLQGMSQIANKVSS